MPLKKQATNKQQNHTVRIIGGQYKRSKLDVLNIDGLRPTPDRLRETLFNWLGDLRDMYCLDMFAGSGALGFECISRYAKYVLMIEHNKIAYQQLIHIADKLKISFTTKNIVNNINIDNNNNLHLLQTESINYLNKCNTYFDIIFIDPPYAAENLLQQSMLLTRRLLRENGLVYVEYNQDLSKTIQCLDMTIIKHIKIGQIFAYLLRKS
jgi:16S rRNA (guanine966-N2)-methyltransferase